ncbi:MAG: phytoene desaturase family protein, partial [Actinomycetota bacterium]
MSRHVVVIGAGMGGLSAAVSLARSGFQVTVLEARSEPGGLASGLERDGFRFDAGPYILLDRPGLDWAFRAVGLALDDHVPLRRIDDVYEVRSGTEAPVRFYADLEQTIAGFERRWPGSGVKYRRFVEETRATYVRLEPLLHAPPSPLRLLRSGGWREAPFLLRPLGEILARTNLPTPIVDGLGIWTHVAGQKLAEAPSPLAFVSSLIHTVGCYYPVRGIASIPNALAAEAVRAGVELRYGTPVSRIRCEGGRATGVDTAEGSLSADAVLSNAGGIRTYVELLEGAPAPVRESLQRLPLQSPGVCAYLAVRGAPRPPYLRFQLPPGELCRLLITPAIHAPELVREGWSPARLLAPMRHADAESGGAEGQNHYLERILDEPWWREDWDDVRVLERRIPAEWGREFGLYRESMNPVMTARYMRAGRLAHRSPHVRGLYLAGSSTHPGQWVSFCAISGVLAAERIREDLG